MPGSGFTSKSGAAASKGRTKGKGKGRPGKGKAAVAAEEAEAAAEAAEARSARARNARQARTDGSVRSVNLSPDDLAACAEAKLELPVEQVALQEMRALKRGWVCALWVEGRLHVYLAGGLEGDDPWIKQALVGGGKESEKVSVAKEQLESQHMVVMKFRNHRPRRVALFNFYVASKSDYRFA